MIRKKQNHGVVQAFVLCASFVCPANAQECKKRLIENTVPYNTAIQARRTNAKIFGVVGRLDATLPLLEPPPGRRKDKFGALFSWGVDSVYNAVRIPATATGDCDSSPLTQVGYDLNAVHWTMALDFRGIKFFYSATSTAGTQSPTAEDRLAGTAGNTTLGMLNTLVGPALVEREFGSGVNGIAVDYAAGLSTEVLNTELRLGYIGTRGVYTNVTQKEARAFVTAVANEGLQRMPFLSFGIDALRTIGTSYTSAYGRRLAFEPPQFVDAAGQVRDANPDQLVLWTAHLRQDDILRVVDVTGAYTLSPVPQINQALVRLHTPEFNRILAFKNPSIKVKRDAHDEWSPNAGLYVGTIRMPDMYFYGAAGGPLLTTGLELNASHLDAEVGYMVVFRMARNDPEMLTQFPYARDSMYGHMSFVLKGYP